MQAGAGESNESVYEEREMKDRDMEYLMATCFLTALTFAAFMFQLGYIRGRAEIRDSYNMKYRCVEYRPIQATPECVAFVLKGNAK